MTTPMGTLGTDITFSNKRRWFFSAQFSDATKLAQTSLILMRKPTSTETENTIVTYLLGTANGDEFKELFHYLGIMYQPNNPEVIPNDLKCVIELQCHTIHGKFESYVYSGAFPVSINFGELDYSSDPNYDIEITWHFDQCEHIAEGATVCHVETNI